MKLTDIIDQANNTYALRLTSSERRTLQYRLVGAGYRAAVTSRQIGPALDAILQTTDHLRSRPRLAVATADTYGQMKIESSAESTDGCPRCSQTMTQVGLVGDRIARYCPACNVTLPMRA